MSQTSFKVDECSWQDVVSHIQRTIPRREWVRYKLWNLCELKCIQMDPRQVIVYLCTTNTAANLHHIYRDDKNAASKLENYLDVELIAWVNAQ